MNELRNLSLKEHKYGIDIEVPLPALLVVLDSTVRRFGCRILVTLAGLFVVFTGLSLVWLVLFVRRGSEVVRKQVKR